MLISMENYRNLGKEPGELHSRTIEFLHGTCGTGLSPCVTIGWRKLQGRSWHTLITSSCGANTARTKAIFMLMITALMWSIGGLLVKLIDLHPLAIAGVRSAIATLVILVFLRQPKITWSKTQVGAALAYAAMVILFVVANRLTTATNAIMLQFTAPVYVALLANYFLKEKTTSFDWVIIGATLCGIALFFLDYLGPSGSLGNILAILSGVSFACFTILMRLQKDGSPMESVLLGNIFSALIGLPFLLGGMPVAQDWVPLMLLGVVQLGLPFILYSLAVKHVSALDAILVPVLEPLLNPVWVFLSLGETPGHWSLLGAAVVITSVTLRYFFNRNPATSVS